MRLTRLDAHCWGSHWAAQDATIINTTRYQPPTTTHCTGSWKARSGRFLEAKSSNVPLTFHLSCLPMRSRNEKKRRQKKSLAWTVKSPYGNVRERNLIQTHWLAEWTLALKHNSLGNCPANPGSAPVRSRSLPRHRVRSLIFILPENWEFDWEADNQPTGCVTFSKTACVRQLTNRCTSRSTFEPSSRQLRRARFGSISAEVSSSRWPLNAARHRPNLRYEMEPIGR